MRTLSRPADTAKTKEHYRFLFIFEGWRLSKTVSGSSWKLAGALDSAAGWLDAIWVAAGSCWLACWLATGTPGSRQHGHLRGTPSSPGAEATNQIAARCKIGSSKDAKLQAYRTYMAYRAYMLQTRRLTVLQGYRAYML